MKLREFGYFIVLKFDVEIGTPPMYRFLKHLKETVPPDCRDFNEQTKEWWIDSDYAPELAELVTKYFKGD